MTRHVLFDTVTGTKFRIEDTGSQAVPEDMPGVEGVFVGGCVSNGVGSLKRGGRAVGAHVHARGASHEGWICFRSPAVFADPAVRWHEYAHILVSRGRFARWHRYTYWLTNGSHSHYWRRVMRGLGQPVPAEYAPWWRRKFSK